MTNLELEELTKALNIYELKEQNSCQIGDVTYSFKKDKIYVTGKIPVPVIQELSMLPGGKNHFLEVLLSLDKRDGEYFRRIELSTIEEFVLFYQYMDDYALNKRGIEANGKDMCDDIISDILKGISEKVDLKLSNEEWIRKKHCLDVVAYQEYVKKLNKKPFFKTEKNMKEYDYNLNIRKNIDIFDMAVNPYINSSTELRSISSMREDLTVNIDNLNLGSEGAMLKVIDNKTGNYIKYERTNTSFSYEVSYDFRGENTFKHTFELNTTKCDKTGLGERIIITQKGKGQDREKTIIFNISTNQIMDENYSIRPITIEEKAKIYDEILESTSFAEEVSRQMFKAKKVYKK